MGLDRSVLRMKSVLQTAVTSTPVSARLQREAKNACIIHSLAGFSSY